MNHGAAIEVLRVEVEALRGTTANLVESTHNLCVTSATHDVQLGLLVKLVGGLGVIVGTGLCGLIFKAITGH